MEHEAVKLSWIVMKLAPDLYPFLKPHELDLLVVLRDGKENLDLEGAVEIVQQSIFEHQKNAYLH